MKLYTCEHDGERAVAVLEGDMLYPTGYADLLALIADAPVSLPREGGFPLADARLPV